MHPHGDVRVVKAEPHGRVRPALREPLEEVLRTPLGLEVVHLLGGLLGVAEVREEAAHPLPQQDESVGSREPGEVADVDHVRDQQRIDPRAGEPSAHAIRTAHAIASFRRPSAVR